MLTRQLSRLDRLIVELERALATSLGAKPESIRISPATGLDVIELNLQEQSHAAGLMRVNHTGEVCAQALYFGQAATTRNEHIRLHLLAAAAEETDHLAWCSERLDELASHPSLLNPFWYAGSFVLGACAGLVSDRVSLGFVVETERQVEAHLGEHLKVLPQHDTRSRAIVARMQSEEAAHGLAAQNAGARKMPPPIPSLMRMASALMKAIAYRV